MFFLKFVGRCCRNRPFCTGRYAPTFYACLNLAFPLTPPTAYLQIIPLICTKVNLQQPNSCRLVRNWDVGGKWSIQESHARRTCKVNTLSASEVRINPGLLELCYCCALPLLETLCHLCTQLDCFRYLVQILFSFECTALYPFCGRNFESQM